jgi:hypothetical protein
LSSSKPVKVSISLPPSSRSRRSERIGGGTRGREY